MPCIQGNHRNPELFRIASFAGPPGALPGGTEKEIYTTEDGLSRKPARKFERSWNGLESVRLTGLKIPLGMPLGQPIFSEVTPDYHAAADTGARAQCQRSKAWHCLTSRSGWSSSGAARRGLPDRWKCQPCALAKMVQQGMQKTAAISSRTFATTGFNPDAAGDIFFHLDPCWNLHCSWEELLSSDIIKIPREISAVKSLPEKPGCQTKTGHGRKLRKLFTLKK